MERGKGTTYLQLESVCFYEKQTPLQYLHELLWIFFFPFIFLFCSKEGWFVLKGFHCNKKYLTRVPVFEGGTKLKSFSAKFKIKSSTLDGQSHMKTETQHKGHVHPAVCSISQTCLRLSMYTFHPSTQQTDREQDVCSPWADRFYREGCCLGWKDFTLK